MSPERPIPVSSERLILDEMVGFCGAWILRGADFAGRRGAGGEELEEGCLEEKSWRRDAGRRGAGGGMPGDGAEGGTFTVEAF